MEDKSAMETNNGEADSSKNEICLSVSSDDSMNEYMNKPKPRMTDQQQSLTSADGDADETEDAPTPTYGRKKGLLTSQ